MYSKFFNVPPMACPRPRVTRYGTHYPPKYRDWLKSARTAFADVPAMQQITLVFVLPRPKRLGKGERVPHDKKPDLDNLIKSVCDALPYDDKTITHIFASKHYAADYEQPHIWIGSHDV